MPTFLSTTTPTFTPMMRTTAWSVALLISLTLTGCGNTPIVEPSSTYQSLSPQSYNFTTCYECTIEAFRELGFRVKSQEKSPGDRTATVISEMRIDDPVRFSGDEKGLRLRVEITPASANAHNFRVATSRWTRVVKEGREPEHWVFEARPDGLHDKFVKTLEARFAARYKPSE